MRLNPFSQIVTLTTPLLLLTASGCGRGIYTASHQTLDPYIPTPFITIANVALGGTSAPNEEKDGARLVFVDNTPGMNGNLLVFQECNETNSTNIYVSANQGLTWTLYNIVIPGAGKLGATGGIQDSVNHHFHFSWEDDQNTDVSAEFSLSYTGGDITGINLVNNSTLFNTPGDVGSPRDAFEVIDATGIHRLGFAGVALAAGSLGLYELAIASPGKAVTAITDSDYVQASNSANPGTTDQLLPNNYTTSDNTPTFMMAESTNLISGSSGSFVVVGGFPIDGKLLSWTITPSTGNNFTVGSPVTRSTKFGSGTLASSSLSVFNAPNGAAYIAYVENSSSSLSGIHIAGFSPAGAWVSDYFPQPSLNPNVSHVVISSDSNSNPVVMYFDASGGLYGEYYYNGSWLAPVLMNTGTIPSAGWAISNSWSPAGQTKFGIFTDSGPASEPLFSTIEWK